MTANFLLNIDSFRWQNLGIDRSACIDDLTRTLGLISECGNSFWGHPDAYDLNLPWGQFHEIVHSEDFELLRHKIPWIRNDHVKTLLRLWVSACTPNRSRTLHELRQEFLNEINGLFGCRTSPDTIGLIYDNITWNELGVLFYLGNQNQIDWYNQNHYFLPNKKYSNFYLAAQKTGYEAALKLSDEEIEDAADSYTFGTLKKVPSGGQKEGLAETLGAEIARRNFYKREVALSTREQQIKGSLRSIFCSLKNEQRIYISIDFEKAAFEICDENGCHRGEYSFNGIKLSDPDNTGQHDIISLKNN